MKLYSTVYGEGEAEYVTQRSRFVACARPVESKEEAEAFFASRRRIHKAADHNVPAFVLGQKQELQWTSDDGEPQGTAGTPILHLLTAKGLTYVALIVARYFGGTKLGTGGLARAYSAAAQEALAQARICDVEKRVLLEYETDYSFYQRIENAARNGVFKIESAEFTQCVKMCVSAMSEEEEKLSEAIANITAGTAKCLLRRVELVRV